MLPERYPLENTFRMLYHLNRFMEFSLEMFAFAVSNFHKNTFGVKAIGMPTMVLTNDPENIQYVLKTNFENFPKGPEMKSRFQELLGNGIFNADGDQWSFHRKTAANLFNLNRFKGVILDTFNDHCNILDHIFVDSQGNPVDIHKLLHKYTLDSIGKIAFSEDIRSLELPTVNFADDFDYCQQFANDSFINPLWRFVKYCTPAGWLYYYRLNRLNRFVYGMVRSRRAEIANPTAAPRNDLVGMFLDRQETYDRVLSDADLRDIILNFIIAGRDTTAQALSWTFYRLCLNPDCQEKARAEINAVLSKKGGSVSENITFETLQEMKFLEAICFETLRLHPSVPKEAKYCANDDVLPDGSKVYRGDLICFVPWAMGRDEKLWPNASEYKPERFLDSGRPSPFVFTAFLAGPRMCLGQNLAILEMKCCLARMLSKFRFELRQDPKSVTYANSLTLPVKGGLYVSATPIRA